MNDTEHRRIRVDSNINRSKLMDLKVMCNGVSQPSRMMVMKLLMLIKTIN